MWKRLPGFVSRNVWNTNFEDTLILAIFYEKKIFRFRPYFFNVGTTLYRDVSTFLDFAHFENVEMYIFLYCSRSRHVEFRSVAVYSN